MTSKTRNTIFAITGIVGLIGTTALTAIGTYRTTIKVLERKKELGVDKLPRKELFRIIFSNYVGALVTGLATGGCMIAAGVKATVTEGAIASGAALVNKAYKDYRTKGIELFGKEQDTKILTEMKKDEIVKAKDVDCWTQDPTFGNTMSILPDDYEEGEDEMLFHIDYYDKDKDGNTLGVYFTSSVPKVMNAIYHFNRNVMLGAPDSSYQASLLDFLGIEPTKYSWNLTYEYLWNDNIGWIDFDIGKIIDIGDNMVCRPITVNWPPVHESLIDEWGNVKG